MTADDGKVRLTNSFLNEVRNNEALFYVIRQFTEDSVPHPMNSIDPLRDVNFLETEFLLYDMSFLESKIEKLKKEIMKFKNESLQMELTLLEKCYLHVEKELPLRIMDLSTGRN